MAPPRRGGCDRARTLSRARWGDPRATRICTTGSSCTSAIPSWTITLITSRACARFSAIFLDELLPAAPDVNVQIAHLAGTGDYADPPVDAALSVFVDSIARN